ncbi:MAG: efflux RND transporter permease subunit [Betaproteobacteria bacterium]|nr:efflux RND transporter permease subunit [Betaproteobacteria bacterium]
MSFSAWVQRHRRSVLFLLATLALAGLFAAFHLPVTLFPNVDFPRVRVSLDAGERPASQMVVQVTMPVEEAIRRVPGVKVVRSRTSRGTADIEVNFGWGTNMAAATLEVNSAVTQMLPSLPRGTTVTTLRMDPTVDPILAYSLTSATLSQTALRDLAWYQLRPLLSSVNGVARVGVTGGTTEEYRVTVDPERLRAYGLTFGDVTRALRAANVISAAGRLQDHYKLYLVVSDTTFQRLAQIREVIVRDGIHGLVRLGDVATVTRSVVPQWIRVTADGKPAVLINIYQQPAGNSVQIAKLIKQKLQGFRSQMPKGVALASWYDQSKLVVASAASVRDAILIGIGLAALILFVFLRNIKITLIGIIVVPAVLATTILLLDVLGMSFNIMTLGGMAAAVGLIIDDAIVMVEHIIRRLRGGEGPHHGKVLAAALEFIRPLSGSSASTVVIFAPLAFLGGITGAFFKALALTMASALVISFFVTWLAVPLLADHLLTQKDAEQEEGGRITQWLHRRYEAILRVLCRRPLWLAVVLVPLLGGGFLAYRHVGSGFMPHMDEGGFVLDYLSPPGTSLSETNRLLKEVEGIIQANPYVQTYSRRTGTQLGGGVTEANEGDFFIRLKPFPRPPITEIMNAIRRRVERNVPGLHIEMAQLMEDLIGDLTAVPQPIEIKIFSDDPQQLAALAGRVAGAIGHVDGVVDIRSGVNPAGDALDIDVNRSAAAMEGMDPAGVAAQVRDYMRGDVATHVVKGAKVIGIRVWVPRAYRKTDNDLEDLELRAPDGHLFPLKRVASITAVTGQPEITRENLKRMVAVTARISGRDMGSVIRDVKRVLHEPGMIPRGVYYELGGLYKQQQIAFRGLIMVFAAAVALVFLLLLFLYERFRISFAIMAIPLLSLSSVFIGLWATGTELNISSMMGMTMIVGIVTEVAIFYFSEYHDLVGHMERREALILAGKNRMRPIAMTTFAAILTLLPLALGMGEGAAMQQPLAVAIISGLMIQLPLVLLVMPVLFDLLEGQDSRRQGL